MNQTITVLRVANDGISYFATVGSSTTGELANLGFTPGISGMLAAIGYWAQADREVNCYEQRSALMSA